MAAKKDMDNLLGGFNTGKRGARHGATGVSHPSRVKWWYYEKDVGAGMAKLREFEQHFAAVQLIFIER